MPDRFLTPSEVANILRVHRSTVQRMAAAGRFPGALSLGTGKRRNWRIPESALIQMGLKAADDAAEAEERSEQASAARQPGKRGTARGFELYRKFSKS